MELTKKAEQVLQRAVQINPTGPVIHLSPATVYHRAGQSTLAQHEAELYREQTNLKGKMRVTWLQLQVDSRRSGIDDQDAEK